MVGKSITQLVPWDRIGVFLMAQFWLTTMSFLFLTLLVFYTQPKQSLYPRVGVLWKCGAAPSENVGITDIRGILSYLILWENYRYWNQSFSCCWLVPHKLWFDFVQRSEMWLAISMVRRSWSPLCNQHVWGYTLHKKIGVYTITRIAT